MARKIFTYTCPHCGREEDINKSGKSHFHAGEHCKYKGKWNEVTWTSND